MDNFIVADSEVTWLVEFLLFVLIDNISENDKNIYINVLCYFFSSVYIGRSITRRRKCLSCKAMLVKSENFFHFHWVKSNKNANFFDLAIFLFLPIFLNFSYIFKIEKSNKNFNRTAISLHL